MPAPNPRPTSPTPVAAAPPVPRQAGAGPSRAAAGAGRTPPIRETIQGNLYTNETYKFQLYRPPGWELIPEARKALPNAITAMGTSDETTLFVVGREALRDSLDSHAAMRSAPWQNLRELPAAVFDKRTLAGLPAVEWRFRGMADGHDWSVTTLTLLAAPMFLRSGNDLRGFGPYPDS